MKIITQGKIPEIPAIQHKCDNCETVFEYEQKDIQTQEAPSWSRDPREHAWKYVICPLCNKRIGVPNRVIRLTKHG